MSNFFFTHRDKHVQPFRFYAIIGMKKGKNTQSTRVSSDHIPKSTQRRLNLQFTVLHIHNNTYCNTVYSYQNQCIFIQFSQTRIDKPNKPFLYGFLCHPYIEKDSYRSLRYKHSRHQKLRSSNSLNIRYIKC